MKRTGWAIAVFLLLIAGSLVVRWPLVSAQPPAAKKIPSVEFAEETARRGGSEP